MNGLMQFFKTTVTDGLIFLLPIVAIVWILGMAPDFALKVAEPLAELVPIDTIAGVAVANLLAGLAILVICSIADLVARSSMASKFVREAESAFLWKFPGYNLVKGLTDNLLGAIPIHPWCP